MIIEVSDSSGTPIASSTLCSYGGRQCVTTDQNGVAVFVLRNISYPIRVSAEGYKTKELNRGDLFSGGDTVHCALAPENVLRTLSRVSVNASRIDTTRPPTVAPTIAFAPGDIERAAGAAEDISRYLGTHPSTIISLKGNGDNTLYVRGGRASETVFLIDGVEFDNISHFSQSNGSGGIVGFVNSAYVNDVDFYAGPIPAGRPPRLSSVVEIDMAGGSFNEHHGSIAAKLTGGMLSLDGPIVRNKASYAAAMRYVDFRPIFALADEPGVPKLGDLFSKVRILVSDKFHIAATGIASYDRFDYTYAIEEQDDRGNSYPNHLTETERIIQGGGGVNLTYEGTIASHNITAGVSLRDDVNHDSLANHQFDSLYRSRYAYNPIRSDDDRRITVMARGNTEVTVGNRHTFATGVRLTSTEYKLSKSNGKQHHGTYTSCVEGEPVEREWEQNAVSSTFRYRRAEYGGHASYSFDREPLHVSLGLRGDLFEGASPAVSPRVSLAFSDRRLGTLVGAWGRYNQYPTNLPARLYGLLHWGGEPAVREIPRLLETVKPERCTQTSLSYAQAGIPGLHLYCAAYYKWYDREFNQTSPYGTTVFDWDSRELGERNGRKWVRGIEAQVKSRDTRIFNFSCAGSLFDVKIRYTDGTWHDDWTAVRYTYSFSAGASIGEHHHVSLAGKGSGGRPYSPRVVHTDCVGRKYDDFDPEADYFSTRLDPLLSFDARYDFTRHIGRAELGVSVEVLNLLNYRPTLDYRFNGGGFEDVRAFGICPIVGFSLAF
ncbi:MAG: hypothetical protein GF363_12830 [Chitinivibrionales bacterium]|nr:hypothetical protein [Chitinivibrionales bacterium]